MYYAFHSLVIKYVNNKINDSKVGNVKKKSRFVYHTMKQNSYMYIGTYIYNTIYNCVLYRNMYIEKQLHLNSQIHCWIHIQGVPYIVQLGNELYNILFS